MDKKPLFLIIFFLLLFPFGALNSLLAQDTNNTSDMPSYFDDLTSLLNSKLDKGEVVNMLEERWKEPISSQSVKTKLMEFNNRAFISFFSFDERNEFRDYAEINGLNIEDVNKVIPAITIAYTKDQVSKLSYDDYRIKYVYPIGSNSYTVPQNIDIGFSVQIELAEVRQALEIDRIHNLGYFGYGISVAVLDSGVNNSIAPALQSHLHYDEEKIATAWVSSNMSEDINDLSGHGTHIVSVLAGNGVYVSGQSTVQTSNYGIAPDASIVNIKVLDKDGFGEDVWLIDGFSYALYRDVDIISASLTSVTFATIGDPIEELMYEAGRRGIPVVASAGNYGPSGNSAGAPALWDYVISVGASSDLQNLAVYTSRGLNMNFSTGVDILAPGNSIGGSDASNGGVRYVSGTSVSAPIVAGVLALLMEAVPDLNSHRYETALFETTVDINAPIIAQGNGIINPYYALLYLIEHVNSDVFTINPRRISPENIYYYECVEGTTTEFNIKIVASDDQRIYVSVPRFSSNFQIADYFDVTAGWNHISFNISLPSVQRIGDIVGSIVFTNDDDISSTINIQIQTRYLGGNVLFDISHENSTENQWFDASTPFGAHSFTARVLKDRGFQVDYQKEGSLILDNVDVLVISDPELNYTAGELDTIYNFVSSGGSLLFLVNSLRFVEVDEVVDDPILSSNYYACNQVLGLFNASVGNKVPIDYVPYQGDIAEGVDFTSIDSFTFWGWPLAFTSFENTENQVVATFKATIDDNLIEFNAVLSTVIGQGRVMMFGSGYPFTDLGLIVDSIELNPLRVGLDKSYRTLLSQDYSNLQLVNDTFNWLISTHRPEIELQISTNEIWIREQFTLSLDIRTKEGNVIVLPDNRVSVTFLNPDNSIKHLILLFNGQNLRYETLVKLEQYGKHILFVPLVLTNHTVTDGRKEVFCNVQLWDQINLIQNITTGIIAFIFLTIVLIPVLRIRFTKIHPKQ
ncbi:MAG: S8/S53 family peptidase [Candidatus Heimdallarchaeota archaeon]|nr:S8/S53 family peptidase [Candidatus Heimdallarchaeota archaeon]